MVNEVLVQKILTWWKENPTGLVPLSKNYAASEWNDAFKEAQRIRGSIELAKCPFCGYEAELSADKKYVTCGNDLTVCLFAGLYVLVEAWQSRPIEDALREQNDELYTAVKLAQGEQDALHKRIKGLKEALERIVDKMQETHFCRPVDDIVRKIAEAGLAKSDGEGA